MNLSLLVAYLVLQFAICYYVSKKISSQEDFLLAGRSLGAPLITLSLFATWFGAETCIGSSAEVFTNGLSGSRADPFGYSLCLIFTGLLIAPRIWNKNYTTLADLYAKQFGTKTEKLAVWILGLSSLIWAAAQLRAFGQVVSSTTNLSADITLFFSFIFIVGYVLFGGLLGDIITDAVQSVVISLGLILLFFFVFKDQPDFFSIIKNQSSERLSLLGSGESIMQRADRWAIPILGSLVAQELISRILAARNTKIAVSSSYIAAFIYIIMGSIPVVLGLIGPEIINLGNNSNEQFIILLAKKYLPYFLIPVFTGALISALLATIDSILIAVSGLVSHNFLIPLLKVSKESKKVLTTRFVVIGAGLVAYLLAAHSESIYSLLEVASSFGTSGILIITLTGLWLKPQSDWITLSTLILGLISTPFFDYILKLQSPFIGSIICCAAFYFCASILDQRFEKKLFS